MIIYKKSFNIEIYNSYLEIKTIYYKESIFIYFSY